MITHLCPLCTKSNSHSVFSKQDGREFFKCEACELIFLAPGLSLGPNEEKEQYDLHENDVNDIRYQNFMEPLVRELKKVTTGKSGLDFGSGPTSVLRHLLKEEKFKISLYDKFYYPDRETLGVTYDFVFASEVVEHFLNPGNDFRLMKSLLRERGDLIIGTSLYDEVPDLRTWSYAMDPTHVAFYSRRTFHWIAENFGFASPVFFSRRGIHLRLL